MDFQFISKSDNQNKVTLVRSEDEISFPYNKVSLRTSLERNPTNSSHIFILSVNFENLTVEFHALYVLNIHIKFLSIWMLSIIQSINFFMHNFLPQNLEI